MIKFSKKYLGFLHLQRTVFDQILNSESSQDKINQAVSKHFENDFNSILPGLPKNAQKILDVGCGLGIVHVFVYNNFQKNNPEIILFDRTESTRTIKYGFYDNPDVFYNNLESAKNILVENNIPSDNITTLEASKDNLENLSGVDLIMSTYSMGFHYSVSYYLEQLDKISNPGCHMILDLRKRVLKQEKQKIEKYFPKMKKISSLRKSERWLFVK